MLKVGLTGGIGCGKSSAVEHFQALGVPVIDADRLAREVVEPGQPALLELVRVFGAGVLTAEQALDRAWLRAKVFADPAARTQLEGILHPLIRQRIQADLLRVQAHKPVYVIIDIPLLVEQGYATMFDRIIVVDCLPEQQLERVRERDGGDEGQIEGIMRAQATRTERLAAATDVLDNTLSKAWLVSQIDALHQRMLEISGY